MIYEVIPMLERLKHSMTKVRNAYSELAVIHIAAKAALMLVGKYYALTDDNEGYRIAIGLFLTNFPLSANAHSSFDCSYVSGQEARVV